MAGWNAVVTDQGRAVLSTWVAGTKFNFDKATGGTGVVATASMFEQTHLVEEKQTMSMLGFEKTDDGVRLKVRVMAHQTPYRLNQLGIWGSVDGGESVLIALFQNEVGVDIPSLEDAPEYIYSFYATIAMSNKGEITINRDISVYVTQGDLDKSMDAFAKMLDGKVDRNELISTEEGVNGIRWWNQQLEVKDADGNWIPIGGIGIIVKVTAPIGAKVTATNGKVNLYGISDGSVLVFSLPTYDIWRFTGEIDGEVTNTAVLDCSIARLYYVELVIFESRIEVTAKSGATVALSGEGYNEVSTSIGFLNESDIVSEPLTTHMGSTIDATHITIKASNYGQQAPQGMSIESIEIVYNKNDLSNNELKQIEATAMDNGDGTVTVPVDINSDNISGADISNRIATFDGSTFGMIKLPISLKNEQTIVAKISGGNLGAREPRLYISAGNGNGKNNGMFNNNGEEELTVNAAYAIEATLQAGCTDGILLADGVELNSPYCQVVKREDGFDELYSLLQEKGTELVVKAQGGLPTYASLSYWGTYSGVLASTVIEIDGYTYHVFDNNAIKEIISEYASNSENIDDSGELKAPSSLALHCLKNGEYNTAYRVYIVKNTDTSLGTAYFVVKNQGEYSAVAEYDGIISSTAVIPVKVNGEVYKTAVQFLTLIITASEGSQIVVSKDSYSYTKIVTNGTAVFYLPEFGNWTVTATLDNSQAQKDIECSIAGTYDMSIQYPNDSGEAGGGDTGDSGETEDLCATDGHIEVVTTYAQSPTCTSSGCTEGTKCSRCGITLKASQYLSPTGHNEVTDNAVAPTCTSTGLTEGSHCSDCGITIVSQKTVAKLEHTPGGWLYLVADPLAGHYKRCSVCKTKLEEGAHVWDSWGNDTTGQNHKRTCQICGYIHTEPHETSTTRYYENESANLHERHWTCSVCGVRGHTSESHTFVNGVCTKCGATQ